MTMREITQHQVNECNKRIKIQAKDNPLRGPADYVLTHQYFGDEVVCYLHFHYGPLDKKTETRGIPNEALLAVVIDRLQAFQNGPYACAENALALRSLEDAMKWIRKRTEERQE